MTVEFGVLGSVEATINGRPADLGHARQRGVLAVLLVEVNHLVTSDQLINRLWGDHFPRRARATLHGYLSHLRTALATTDDAAIVRQPGGYVLATAETATVDLHSFRQLVTLARAADDDRHAVSLFDQALRLWRAEPFASLDTPWINALRDTLRQERLAAQLDLGDRRLRLGQHAALLAELTVRAQAHPLDERLAGQLMLTLHRCGRAADALNFYERTRRRLVRELGIGPGSHLRQVQAQILRQDAAPLPAPPGSTASSRIPGRPSEVPAQLPLSVPAFTGRRDEIAQLDGLLPAADGAATWVRPAAVVISAVSGMAGVGKTALAVYWAHRARTAFPDGQLYVNLRGFDPGGSVVGPEEAVRGFLDAFGVPPARIPYGFQAQVGLYRSLLADRRVLVVLDNARDAEQVRPLLPGAPGSLALITSRNRLTSLAAAEGAHLLSVDQLPPTEARALLTGRLGRHRVPAEPVAVDEIIERCAGLPLALAIVGARAVAQPHLPLAVLADELREARTRLDALDGGDAATQIRAVFSWSYQTLGSDAARLFRLLGLHPGPDVAVPAAAALADVPPERARVLLAELTAGQLLTEHTSGRYTTHDLLRAYATDLVTTHDGHDVRGTATHRMLDHYLHTAYLADEMLTSRRAPIALPTAQPGARPEKLTNHDQALAWFAVEYPILLASIEQAPSEFATHTWQLALTLTTFLDRQGHWSVLATAQTTALNRAQHQNDLTGQASAHRGLGLAYDRLGRSDDARTHHLFALDLFQKLDNHAGQARIHQNLGRMCSARGDFTEALDHARQTLIHYQACHDRGGQAIAFNHLGWYRTKLGDYDQALQHCRQALALAQEIGDLNGQAHTWDSLGYIYHHRGDYERAVDCYQHALDMFSVTGDRHSEATGLAYLGDTHHAAADHKAARDAWTRALGIFDELGHPDADPLRDKLVRTMESSGQIATASTSTS